MPFNGLDSTIWDSLPPLDAPRPAASSFFAGVSELSKGEAPLPSKPQLFRLCFVDEAGRPAAYPSDLELQRLIEGDALPAPAAPEPAAPPQQPAPPPKEPSFQELLAETHKRGGPLCAHCGATESPQWRRGPPHKAILCNACGTRYRRTNQLGSTVPSNLRKRQAAQQRCSGEAGAAAPAAKQPRILA